jgi:ubiquitin-activating enzyme E1
VPMCTLRNFPQITDHCIEWSRDQFELLFVKLAKQLEMALTDPAKFHHEMTKGTPTESAAQMRNVVSFARAALGKSVAAAAQLAYDIFYFSFRDNIVNLQLLYPKDARIIDKDGTDKGPFWSEKKRFPTAAAFNPDDESHAAFLRAATVCRTTPHITCLLFFTDKIGDPRSDHCFHRKIDLFFFFFFSCFVVAGQALFASNLGVVAPKQEGDDDWCGAFRAPGWAAQTAKTLSVPTFVKAPIHVDGETAQQAEAVNNGAQAILDQQFAELQGLLTQLQGAPIAFVPADFEKDDDFNFHIEVITAAANLRCDNYGIKRTDFNGCKVIAGKIIAAIATTTAAVCGLVMLELIKVQQGKETDFYMNRQVGLGVNAHTSFTQNPPIKHETRTVAFLLLLLVLFFLLVFVLLVLLLIVLLLLLILHLLLFLLLLVHRLPCPPPASIRFAQSRYICCLDLVCFQLINFR